MVLTTKFAELLKQAEKQSKPLVPYVVIAILVFIIIIMAIVS